MLLVSLIGAPKVDLMKHAHTTIKHDGNKGEPSGEKVCDSANNPNPLKSDVFSFEDFEQAYASACVVGRVPIIIRTKDTGDQLAEAHSMSITHLSATLFTEVNLGDRVQVFIPYFGVLHARVVSVEGGRAFLSYALNYMEEDNLEYALGCIQVMSEANRRRIRPFSQDVERRRTPRFDLLVNTSLRRVDHGNLCSDVTTSDLKCEVKKVSIRTTEIKCRDKLKINERIMLCGRLMRVAQKRGANWTLELIG